VIVEVGGLADNAIAYYTICLNPNECYYVNMSNSADATGWNNGYFWINGGGVQFTTESLDEGLTDETTFFSIDGTCSPIWGCTDPEALNYNADANQDDGTCYYPFVCENGTTALLTMTSGLYPTEVSYTIIDANGTVVYYGAGNPNNIPSYASVCLADGCYTVMM